MNDKKGIVRYARCLSVFRACLLLTVGLYPKHVGEVLTVGKLGILGIYAVSVAECTGLAELGFELEGADIALFAYHLELFAALVFLLTVLNLVDYTLYAEIVAEAVGVELDD